LRLKCCVNYEEATQKLYACITFLKQYTVLTIIYRYKVQKTMQWNILTDSSQLDSIDGLSIIGPVMIFKHSTRCSISTTALDRLQRSWKEGDNTKIIPYYLDLIKYRETSNAIAERYGVEHESPQVIVIKDGKAVYNESHMGINYSSLMALD
jgi:bacillithiol system protein YtxJ